MEPTTKYRSWMAEQIAKSYLYETGLLDVYQNEIEGFDFICMLKNNLNNIFAVEVKASQYTKSQILKQYKKTREKFLKTNMPVLMLYINYIDRTGYFEFINKKLLEELQILNTINLKTEIENLTFA